LLASGVAVPIGARAFEIIEVLVRSANELVTKTDLMDRIWPGAIVGENTLQVHISAIRKALGPDRAMLKTASGRGYRLLGDWTPRQQGSGIAPVASPPMREPGAPLANNFPLIVGQLIGRAAAVRHVRDLVSAYRVVTLTGPGGIGKTSLAIVASRSLLANFDGGGWFVELASLSNPDLVPSTVASALGLKLSGEVSAESVARAVGAKQLLLVLDNCEHVIDAAASLAERFVGLCPHIAVLVTSREVLRIDGEAVYRVPPLEVPAIGQETPDHILGHSAVELFITRTNALDVRFSPRAKDLTSVAAICRRLDGIPLAIEFAAASAATLGIEHVAVGLRDRFALLTHGRRTALARQRTLRATLDWSHELLPEAERRLLRRLAVFPAGFTLDAAVAVMTDTGLDAAAVTDGIANLVMKSLVAQDKTSDAPRWYLLETIRAYALEKLVEHGESDTAAGRHAVYFRDFVTPLASGARSSLSEEDLARCVVEIDNVRAALDWSFSSIGDPAIGVDLTVAYAPVWQHLLLVKECRERCERALLSLEPHVTANTRPRMQLQLALAGAMFITLGAAEQAKTILTEALDTADMLNDIDAQARALASLRSLYVHRGEYGPARIVAERIEEIADRSDDPVSLRVAWRQIGTALLTSGRPREAQQYFERVLRSPIAPGNHHGVIFYNSNDHASARAMLARALWMQGFTERALHEAHASLEELHGADHKLLLCRTLYYGICRIAPMIGDFATADREIARLIDIATGLNARFWETAGHFLKGKLLVERGEFAQGLPVLREAFETCDRTGWRLSYPEFKGALALAHAGLGRLDEALDALEDAVVTAGEGKDGQVWYVPELLRIKGEVLLRQAADQSALAAADCFNQAGEMAREQDALFWELRVALSLARLRMTQGRDGEAKQILAPVYGRFTDGYETSDLRAAKALLDSLPK
jgi:predicted ATPase/DNA-binding winged helix-turn-helix (wHTH) protein/Tfp pilus assembly protein PilF